MSRIQSQSPVPYKNWIPMLTQCKWFAQIVGMDGFYRSRARISSKRHRCIYDSTVKKYRERELGGETGVLTR